MSISIETLALAKKYTDKTIANIVDIVPKLQIKIVDSLPTQDISDSIIYLLRNDNENENDLYDEYIYLENKWEKLGTSSMSKDEGEETDLNILVEILSTGIFSDVLATNGVIYLDDNGKVVVI